MFIWGDYMKKHILAGLVLLSLFLVGCETKEVVKVNCEKPYILVGTDCCLDKDDNSICDKDEQVPEIKEVKETKEDGCGDGYCEEGEDCENCPKDCGKCFSLSDLQADINKVIDWKAVLTKEKGTDIANYYLYTGLRARYLGKYEPDGVKTLVGDYHQVSPKRYIWVSQIKDKKDYIQDSDEFYDYIVKSKDYMLEPLNQARDKFQEELKSGELLKLMFGNKA